ncbi:MAG: flavin reductase family protein [Hyphomicrobiaceae bacterium]|nr:flavin reductase family protein [Hyphomicrobiaceae bacterium]
MDRRPGKGSGITAESYRALMRHQAGAVTVVATELHGMRAGLTATAFSSLSDSPPTILVCIHRTAGAHDSIIAARAFSVNILAAEQQGVAERFSGVGGVRGAARFEGSSWSVLKTGSPVLDGALASLDCELVEHHVFTTHSIFIGHVVGGSVRAEAQPLLYFRGDYWNIGQNNG